MFRSLGNASAGAHFVKKMEKCLSRVLRIAGVALLGFRHVRQGQQLMSAGQIEFLQASADLRSHRCSRHCSLELSADCLGRASMPPALTLPLASSPCAGQPTVSACFAGSSTQSTPLTNSV